MVTRKLFTNLSAGLSPPRGGHSDTFVITTKAPQAPGRYGKKMAVLILVLFPIVYLFAPRLAFGVLLVAIVLLYQQRTR